MGSLLVITISPTNGAELVPGERPDLGHSLAATRAVPGEPAFAAAGSLGRAMTPDQAIARALEEDAAGSARSMPAPKPVTC